jgi:hypothetical protein
MRRISLSILCVVALGALVVPASAGTAVKSKVKILFATDEAHGQIGVYGKLKTTLPCKGPKRKFILFNEDGKVDQVTGLSDAFIITDKVALGDTVQMKATTGTLNDNGEVIKCKGSISKEFQINELENGG